MIWDWRDEIKIGDILYERGRPDRPRVVRKASYCKKTGHLRCVTFTILRCSWTNRCTTTVNRHDLKYRHFSNGGASKIDMNIWDKRINAEIIDHNLRKLDCCDVRGIR